MATRIITGSNNALKMIVYRDQLMKKASQAVAHTVVESSGTSLLKEPPSKVPKLELACLVRRFTFKLNKYLNYMQYTVKSFLYFNKNVFQHLKNY